MGITFFEWGKIKNGNCLVTFYGKKPSVNGGVIMTYGDLTNRKRGLTNNHGLLKESQIKNRNLDHIIPYIYIYIDCRVGFPGKSTISQVQDYGWNQRETLFFVFF